MNFMDTYPKISILRFFATTSDRHTSRNDHIFPRKMDIRRKREPFGSKFALGIGKADTQLFWRLPILGKAICYEVFQERLRLYILKA